MTAAGPAWRRSARAVLAGAPLFVQVLSLILLSLIAIQALAVAIIFSLPPPAPDFYRISEVAQALQGQPVAPRDGQPLTVRTVAAPPKGGFVGRYTREVMQELSRRLAVPPAALVVVNDPPGWLVFRGGRSRIAQRLQHSGLAPDDHILVAPFQVALRSGGGWRLVEPRSSFPNPWQQRILLWIVLSLLALAPIAYLFARRLAAPFSAFAAAAERLGRDPGAPPLELSGPAEIVQAVSAFNQMQDRLRRYVDDRTAIVGAVAHDLRTPLTRLRFRIEGAPEALAGKMASDIDQMDAMISASLAFVRDATRPAERLRLELVSLVESIADEMAETGLDVAAEGAPPVVIEGDPIALRRLITNLLDNAVKFGGRARARVYAQDGAAVIEVDDEGPGIPAEDQERVFEPFHRGERSRSRETGGAGLGLAVVRSVARAHGGDIWLQNRAGGGLRARARLPL